LWGDEAFVAVTLLERDFAGLSHPPEFYQIVPPGFLWTEWLAVHWLGSGELALRLIPFLAGVASLLLFWRFCREVTTRRTTLVAVAILAASFYPVRHAAEVKPYATDLLVSLILSAMGWSVYRRIDSLPRWLALIAAAVLGVWCSYPTVFPAGAVVMLLGATAIRRRSAGAGLLWGVYCGLLVASWGAMYFYFAGPQSRASAFLTELKTWRDAFPPMTHPWRLPLWLIKVHTGLMLAYPQGGHHYASAPTALLALAGCVRIAKRKARRPLLLLLLGPLIPAMLAAALHRYPYGTSTRVMLYMAPAVCLLAAEGLIAVLRLSHRSNRGPIIVAGLLAIFPITGIAHDLIWPYVGFDNVVQRRLTRRLAEIAAPGDEYVVFNSVTPPPLIPDLMITRWLQRVAVARYYLRSAIPARIRWEPPPATVCPAAGGHLRLVIQRHGDDRFFSEQRLANYQSTVATTLGLPQLFDRFDLPNGESWTIWSYPSSVPGNAHTLRSGPD
jgi:hypothetical protein